MYCPKCGAQNIDNAKFCRACGTDLNIVTQALEGRRPPEPSLINFDERLVRRRFENGIKNILMGIGFLVMALYFWNSWGIWILIPAMAMLGKGIPQIVGLKYERKYTIPPVERNDSIPSKITGPLLQDRDPMMMPPPSVTEDTTRNLEPLPREREKI